MNKNNQRVSQNTIKAIFFLLITSVAIHSTCAAANFTDIPDNAAVRPVDSDGDGVDDNLDNCINAMNGPQRDTDGDGLGNICDADLNQDCVVNFLDIAQFAGVFGTADPDADIDGSGAVNFLDFTTFANSFAMPPGPSGVANLCSATLTLSGVVTGAPIPFAALTAELVGTGGGTVQFFASAAGDGSYSLNITAPSPDDFVTLTADGTGTQAFVRLKSLAGTAAALAAAGGNDGTVDSTEENALDVTHLSTAFAVLAEEANGGPLSGDADLTSIAKRVDPASLLKLAAMIKAVIDDPVITLPTGVPNTLALVENPETRQDFYGFLFANYPLAMDAAIVATANDLQVAYSAAELSGDLYLTRVGNLGLFGAYHLAFGGAPAVDLTVFAGTGAASWAIDGSGSLIVSLATPLLTGESFPTVEDPDNPGTFIQTLQQTFLEQITVHRFRQSDQADHAFVVDQGFRSFPDLPALDDVPFAGTPELTTAMIAINQNQSVSFDGAALEIQSIGAMFSHQDNVAQGTANPNLGFDTLDFNNDGSGSTRRRGLAYTWQVLANGELELLFANGDITRIRALFNEDSGVLNTVVFGQLAGGSETTHRSIVVERDETQDFDMASLLDKRFRSALVTLNTSSPPSPVFDFMLSAAGDACRNPGSASSTWTWSLVGGRMELFRSFDFDPAAFFFRTWQPVRKVGDDYWVIETLQTSFDGTPQVNAAQTPGRLNIYSLEQDLTGNLRPTLLSDAFSTAVDTPVILMLDDFLGNDADPENDEIFLRGNDFTSNFGGTVEIVDGDGIYPLALRYTPPPGFVGTDLFNYTADDLACGNNPPSSSFIEITVE